MENQKDVFEHLPLQEIRTKSRIKKSMEEHLKRVQSNEGGGSKSKKHARTSVSGDEKAPDKISNAADGPSALDDLNW